VVEGWRRSPRGGESAKSEGFRRPRRVTVALELGRWCTQALSLLIVGLACDFATVNQHVTARGVSCKPADNCFAGT